MHEVQPDLLDVGAEVRKAVERVFLRAPVKALAPVADEVAQKVAVDSLAPRGAARVAWPAPAREPLREIVEDRIVDMDREGPRPAHRAIACSQLGGEFS
jgi:hypothetical protein